MVPESASSLSPKAVRTRCELAGEPAWLAERRLAASEAHAKLPPPRFARTDLTNVDVDALAGRALAGRTTVRRSAPARDGVLVLDLVEAAREHADVVRPLLSQATVRPEDGRIEALSAATWSSGTLVYVPRGVEVAEPVVVDATAGPDGAISHTLVVAEPTSKVSILERWRSRDGGDGALVAGAVEVVARDGARVQYASVQDLGDRALHLSTKRASVGRDASVTWMDAQFGSRTSVSVVESVLANPGASTLNLGAFFGSGAQHLDITSSALHRAPHTSSQITTKGAVSDRAYAAYYGLVNIGPAAPGSTGHQAETTLLLSEEARADSVPKLDVENNDVRASHAAAVGQVDRDQLFYAMTRGLGEREARRTLVEGFFEPLVLAVPLEEAREDLRAGIARRLA